MTPTINDVCLALEELAPLSFQESYDNAGLLIGDRKTPVTAILLTIDVTEEILQEALDKGCNMIVSHHPLIFRGLKSITGRNMVERCVIKAIRHNIAIYASHTNLDSVVNGVSSRMAEKLGLTNCQILQPKADALLKLVTFVPHGQLEAVRKACFEAGAGHIGNYDSCSYSSAGNGTFRANEQCNPFVGEIGEIYTEPETRLEIILPTYIKNKVTKALIQAHPYEEPAFDFIPLKNNWNKLGFGVIGQLEREEEEVEFLTRIKQIFNVGCIKHTALKNKPVKTVALCGGSGADLIHTAIEKGADVFISADFKYHDYFIPENRILLADIGHFESEQFTKEIFYDQLTKKFPKFAIHFSEINTNPITFL
jgi:dinuclear metal center YbgI/SA1388 family protein